MRVLMWRGRGGDYNVSLCGAVGQGKYFSFVAIFVFGGVGIVLKM